MYQSVREYVAEAIVHGEPMERSHAAIAGGLLAIADQLQNLGNGSAATEMGAIENLAKEVRDGFSALADSIQDQSG